VIRLQDDIEESLHDLRQRGNEFAVAKGNRVRLEHGRKGLIALLMVRAAKDHTSVTAQEREARASAEYKTHCEGEAAAVELEERTRYELKIAEFRLELFRTESANKRTEFRNT
tara:strand:- start:2112 stop:2450 length:339 start_codon:yes stop_codon:yes gene_type:complete